MVVATVSPFSQPTTCDPVGPLMLIAQRVVAGNGAAEKMPTVTDWPCSTTMSDDCAAVVPDARTVACAMINTSGLIDYITVPAISVQPVE